MIDINQIIVIRIFLLKELKLYLKHDYCFGLVCNSKVCFC